MANLPDRSSEASLDEKFAGGISEKQSDSDGSSFPSDVSSEEEYPEGGRDAVLTVVGAFLVNFIEIGMTSVTGTLQAQYSMDQLKNKTQSEVAWINTFQLFVTFFLSAFIGRVFDSVGPKVLLASGTLLMVFGLMMISLCKEYYQFFLAQGLVLGAGSALVYGPVMACIAHWYKRKRATMTSIASSAGAIGSVVLPLVLNNLTLAVGFPWAIRIIGFISLVLLTPAVFIVKARLSPRQFAGWSSAVDFGGLRDVRYVLFCVGAVLQGIGLYNPLFYGQLFAQLRGYPQNVTTYILSIMNAGTLVGRIITGVAADKFGPLNVISIWCTISSIVLLCWIFVDDLTGFIFWAIAYGVSSSAYVPLVGPSIAKFTVDMSRFGGFVGLCSAIESSATLVSAPIAGALLDVVHNRFNRMIIFSALMCFGGSLFLVASRIAGSRRLFVKY